MTASKPEVVAYRYTASRSFGKRNRKWHYQESFPQHDNRRVEDIGVLEPLIRLTDHERLQAEAERLQADHESARAADKARIAELEAYLALAKDQSLAIQAGIQLEKENTELLGLLRECREALAGDGTANRMRALIARIDAALAQQGKEGEK